jgi:hypothetical protein
MNSKIALPAFFFVLLSAPAAAPQEPSTEQQQEFELVVPEGTVIPVVLTAYLNSKTSQIGDTVYADTTYPIWIQQRLVIPKGSTVRGTITDVKRPGRIKGKGHLAVRFDDILLPNGITREFIATFRGIHGSGDENIDRKSETVSAGSSKGDDAGTIVGTTSQGAIIGAIAGGGTGAAIGSGAGGLAGLATVLFTRGRDLVLSPGTQFELELNKPMKFSYNEIQFTDSQLNNAQREIRTRQSSPDSRGTNLGRRRTLPFPGIGFPRFPLH